MSQWRRRFEVGALDADVGSRAQQLQAFCARPEHTAVHIKDLSLGKLEHAATPGTALGVDGACARECALRRSSGASRAMHAAPSLHRCCQQLLAVRAMLASVGDGREQRVAAAVCPTLLAMPPRTFDCKRARAC